MLDILVIALFSGQIGRWAEKKGYKRGLYRGLVIAAWFSGEILGLVVGIFLFAGSGLEEAVYFIILPVFLGAGVGIMTMVFIVGALPFRSKPAAVQAAPVQAASIAPAVEKPVPPWTCPRCGYNNTYRGDRCFNCKKLKPVTLG